MLRASVAVAAVGSALAALVSAALETGPLPLRAQSNCVRDLWPDKDLAAVSVGSYEWEVYGVFGRKEGWPPIEDMLEPQRCIAFQYDEQVLEHPTYLTVRFDAGQVSGRWLTDAAFGRPECRGVSHKLVDLKGYYHAAACW
jgi:hypothetical protein